MCYDNQDSRSPKVYIGHFPLVLVHVVCQIKALKYDVFAYIEAGEGLLEIILRNIQQ